MSTHRQHPSPAQQPTSATPGAASSSASDHKPLKWAFPFSVIEPSPLDTVVVLKNPHKVEAGDVIGQFGHYLRYTDAKLLKAKPTRPLLHLEVFAGPELKAFIDKSRARAKELPAAKTFLEISPGARLVTNVPEPDQTLPQSQGGLKLVPVGAANASRWIKVQPKAVATADSGAQGSLPVHGSHAHGSHHAPHQTLMNVGSPVWVEAALANTTITSVVKGWTNFPLSLANAKGPGADFRDVFRRAELDKLGPEKTAIDDQGHHWWYIELGAKDGSIRQGWVCEENPPLVRMCGPWDWPGFDLVDNSSFKPVDMLKRYIYASEQFLVGEEQSEFEQSALTVNAGGLITQLEKAIDANHDGKVTAQELQHAQETPWTAEALSHLVVRSETEWGGGLGKWEELSPLMKKLLWLWQAEMERIGKLQWWEQAAGIEGFPKEPNPWHFHPVGLVGNFVCNCHCINVEAFLKTYEAQHTSFETGAHPLDATSKENLRVFVQGILDYYKTYENGECNIQYIAYMLATARLETKKYHKDLKMFIYFEPTSENGSLQYFDKYDPILADTEKHRKRAISNGNTENGDGYKYRGRGYVQVTWKNAYRAIGDKIGIDLVSNPDRMQEPAIAAWATVYGMETGLFTGKKLSDYIGAVKQDYYNARQIINGHDQAETIAGFAVRFKTLLESTTC